MLKQNYFARKSDFSISLEKATFYSLFALVPPVSILYSFYGIIWGYERFFKGLDLIFGSWTILLPTFIIGTVLHEAIHGFSWAFFGKKPLKTIKFGFHLKTLSPYAHCQEPLEVNAYRLGAIMPGLILGFVPSIIAIITGNESIIVLGLLFTFCAGGDFLIVWLIRKVKPGKLVIDHPTRAGCYILYN